MKNPLLPAIAVAALITLAACDSKPKAEVVDSRAPDPMASALANAAPVELPPAVKASVTFRCKDNSLIFVDFFQGDKLANFRSEKNGKITQLKADAAGQPFVADGVKLTGTPKAVTVEQPGKSSLSCKA